MPSPRPSAAVFASGASGILGWHLDVVELTRPLAAYGAMKYNTALSGILGMLDLCIDSELEGELLQQVETARSAAETLLVIVNDLLDLSKIEAGRLDIEAIEFDLRDCLRDTMHSLRESARRKGLAFSRYVAPDVPSHVTGDPGGCGRSS